MPDNLFKFSSKALASHHFSYYHVSKLIYCGRWLFKRVQIDIWQELLLHRHKDARLKKHIWSYLEHTKQKPSISYFLLSCRIQWCSAAQACYCLRRTNKCKDFFICVNSFFFFARFIITLQINHLSALSLVYFKSVNQINSHLFV